MTQSIDQAEQIARLWMDFWSRMATAALSAQPPTVSASPADAATQARDAMLEAASQWTDQFMRSPPFLEQMRRSMDATIELRQQMNQWMTRAHHEMQSTARQDIESLMSTIRHLEQRLLDRLEQACERIEQLEQRLDRPAGRRRASRPADDDRAPNVIDAGQVPGNGQTGGHAPEAPLPRRGTRTGRRPASRATGKRSGS